ncbi:MAG: S8 family serine peptidase [Alphaproteobacteria bacterium]|nr:S8 family serine peptidase [Alphaproteobacteria bacterium]
MSRTAIAESNPQRWHNHPPPPPSGGSQVIVAILDTGVDLDHPEFAGRIVGGACFGAASMCSGASALGDDNHGHGTHVAGIVAAAANGTGNTGVAPNAAILPVKVLSASGSGSDASIASGINYAVSQGARVINMSLGGPSPSSVYLAPLSQAAASSVIVAAAGNSGNALAPGYPAAYATQAGIVGSMIIAGSVGPTNVISSFSQTPGNGGCVASGGKTTCFKDVFLVAPGQSIYSAYPGGYATMSGTSMATPYISGVAARLFAASPYLTPQQVVSIMFQSATDLGAPGTDAVYGRGLVNLQAALAPLGTQSIATSGATTASFSGTGNAGTAGLSGVLGFGFGASKIAKDAVFFDSFGRDYRTDLTVAVGSAALSLEGLVTQGTGLWHSVDFAGNGFSASGFVSEETTNAVLGGARHSAFSDMVVRARLGEGATLIVGHNAGLQGQVNALDLAASEAYDGLFLSASALNSPFLALTEEADLLGAGVALTDTLTLTFGHARGQENATFGLEDEQLTAEEAYAYLTQDQSHARSAENTLAAVSWRFAPWGVAGVNIAQTGEANSLLGSDEAGALMLTADAATTSVGFGVRANLGDDWVASASWSHGSTAATPVANGLVQSFSGIESQAYGFALAKRGVFGNVDSLGLAISRPLHITSGTAVATASTGVTETREIVYSTEVLDLASPTPETDFELGYSTIVGEGLLLQTSAMYQQNAGGVSGENAVAAFVTLKGSW